MFKSVTVIGAGLMGSGIAAHLTNAGIKVNLLDVVLEENENRNFLAQNAVNKLTKIVPSPLTLKSNINFIRTGNIEDDLHLINESDWTIEAVLENLDVKKKLYKKIENIMRDDLIVSSNTSTIPLNKLIKGRIEKFRSNFFITHFFNPPRYLKLLEVVSSKEAKAGLKKKIVKFCDIYLGKSVIECKDSPGFIANRIGVFWMLHAAVKAINENITVEEADQIVMRVFNAPKTGVFGLIDVVGLDLVPPVLESLLQGVPRNDEYHQFDEQPEIFHYMLEKNLIGRKADGGFYKLGEVDGKKLKYSLNLNTREYSVSNKPNIDSLNLGKKNIKAFLDYNDRYSNYAWSVLSETLCYVLLHVEELSDDILSVDTAMREGFGLKQGPFELIDALGAQWLRAKLKNSKKVIPDLLHKIGDSTFYKVEDNQIKIFDFKNNQYCPIKKPKGIILLSDIKRTNEPIKKVPTASLWDIGDGVTVFEIHSKGNSIDIGTMEFLNQSIDLISSSYRAMIIYNEGDFFSAGVNLGEAVFLGNIGLETEVVDQILKKGQQTFQKLKYSNFPVIAATSNMALGGGCEIVLHSDHVQAHVETYIGLTEAALGICPAWGGCKEMLKKFASDKILPKGPMPSIIKAFETIGMAKTSSSAHEARELGYLSDTDDITMNKDRLLFDAKVKALELISDYKSPEKFTFRLPGKTAYSAMKLTVDSMLLSGQISCHDQMVGEQIATILSGGDTDIIEEIDEDQMLKLERVAIQKLFREKLTLDRLEHLLETGKILRN